MSRIRTCALLFVAALAPSPCFAQFGGMGGMGGYQLPSPLE